jgi:ATP-binding cassette subfamily B protein
MDNASMEYAASLAQAGRFIAEKDDNYQSEVAQGGSNLSGGQKQRLSIARAIAAKPRFLLFDDSFSALDYRTDLLVRQALREKLSDTTVIIVAQRIATVMQADTILVLDEGRLVGQGTHQELMVSCSAYQQIARSQLSEEELAGKGGMRRE